MGVYDRTVSEIYNNYIFVLVISNRFGGILTGIAFPIYRLFSIVLGLGI